MSLEKLTKAIPEAIEAISINTGRFNEKLQKIRKNRFVKIGEKTGIITGVAIAGLNFFKAPITDKALEFSFWSSNNNCNNPTQTENIKKRCENWDKLKKEYIASDGTVVNIMNSKMFHLSINLIHNKILKEKLQMQLLVGLSIFFLELMVSIV